ncbi:MAG: DUF1176 domain-containing protein [Rhodospirillaceae bacterium]|nr:DUF1176 domain-containing protein [Rhodospirillaceae bacterium]
MVGYGITAFSMMLMVIFVEAPAFAQNPKDVIMKRHLELPTCERDVAYIEKEADLGDGYWLYGIACQAAAYNESQVFYVSKPADLATATRVKFRIITEDRIFGHSEEVWNPGFDPQTQQISSRNFGRGIGDCGRAGLWRRLGTKYELIQFRYKSDCDGQDDEWPIIFQK